MAPAQNQVSHPTVSAHYDSITYHLPSCLAHVINLATQTLISSYSKAPHYSPHDPKSHELSTRDEIGLIRSICVKVCLSTS